MNPTPSAVIRIDAYTKIILTLIALLLAALVLRPISVQAQSDQDADRILGRDRADGEALHQLGHHLHRRRTESTEGLNNRTTKRIERFIIIGVVARPVPEGGPQRGQRGPGRANQVHLVGTDAGVGAENDVGVEHLQEHR